MYGFVLPRTIKKKNLRTKLFFAIFSLQAALGTMDFIIDTIAAVHPLAPLLGLLKMNGKLVTVGLPEKPLELPIFPLVLGKMHNN